jgi:hypothetical protein
MSTFAWLKVLLATIGVPLMLFGDYLYLQQWSHVNIKTRAYTYISEAERDRRSLKAGFAMAILTFGVCFIIPIFMSPLTIESIIMFLTLPVCLSPLLILAAIFRMRKDLEPYTKMKDDVVSLENKKN